jgi:transcriptional regulator with XRE-family HTH domain
MHTRLFEIIQYKTGGKQTEFASLFGWSPQYLVKLLKGENFGLQPVLSVITKLSEINARWLLTGEGEMIMSSKYTDIRKMMYKNVIKILDMEKYMPVMNPQELREFEQIVTGKKKADFNPDTVEKWEGMLQQREKSLETKFKAAYSKSNASCSLRKAKKL